MAIGIAKPLELILDSVQKRMLGGNYTLCAVDFKMIENKWHISYGVKNNVTGNNNMTKYEPFDITEHISCVKDMLYRYGFYARVSTGNMSFVKPI